MAEVLDIVVRQRGARRVSKDIAAIGIAATSTSTRLKTMQQALKGTTAAMGQASTASGRFTAACQKTSKCTQKAAAGLKRTRIGLSGVGTGAFVAGAALTAGFTRPLVAAIGAAGDFESAMNLVGVLTNVDRASAAFDSLEKKALELGSTTQFTAVQAAEGMRFLAQAGFEADQVLSVIPNTLNLAAAAAIDLGRASDISTNILKGFRLEVKDLPQAIDILAATFSSSNVNIEQLAASFKKAGPVAVKFGQEFKDVAAVVGALGDAGIQAEESGVALRRMFINLQQDSAKSNSILRKFGIAITDDVTGNLRPLVDIFQDIAAAGLSPAESINLFGARALAAAGIIEDSKDILEEFAKSISNSVGRAAEIGEARLRGFNGATLLMTSALEGLGIAIAKSGLDEFFTKIIKGLTEFIRSMTKLPKPILFVIGVVLTLGAVLGALLIPIGLIAVGLSTLLPLFEGLTFATFSAGLGTAATSLAVFLGPVSLVIAGLVLMRDVAFELGGETLTLGNLTAELGSSFVSLGKDAALAFDLLIQGSGSTTNALAEDSNTIIDNLPSFNDFVASAIAGFDIFGRVVAAVFVRIGKGIAKFSSNIVDAFNSIPEAIKAAFDGDETTSAGEILASKFRVGFIAEFEGFGDEVAAIVADSTKKAQFALSALGETDFVQRAAARGRPTEEAEKSEGGGGSKIEPSEGPGLPGGFNVQQVAAAEAVAKLTQNFKGGAEAAIAMATATNTLNTAQQLQVISGAQNVAILEELRTKGGEEFLASINPVTAAYLDQRVALEELIVAKQLFNLTDQEALIAEDLIQEKLQERLLGLDQFKEKLSLVDATRRGLTTGFENFADSLGTQFDIIAGGAEQLGGIIANSLTTAIKDGELSFKDFALAVVDGIQQIIIQLIIQIALQAALKALGGGGGGGGAAGGADIKAAAGGAAISGTVGQTFLVGEEGPELFKPKTAGNIIPNGQSAAMMNAKPAAPPQVNVQVVNVSDPSEVPDAMSSTEGEKVIMNTINKNRNQLKELL